MRKAVKAMRDLGPKGVVEDVLSARRRATRYSFAYRRLLAAIKGVAPEELGTAILENLSSADELESIRFARSAGSEAALLDAIESGDDLSVAVGTAVRKLITARDYGRARGLSQSLQRYPHTHSAGCIGEAIACASTGLDKLAWHNFAQVPRDEVIGACAPEYALAAARSEPTVLDGFADDVIAAGSAVSASAGIGVLRGLVAGRRTAAAERVLAWLQSRGDVSDADADDLAWLGSWVERETRTGSVPSVDGAVAFAVMGFNSPDRAGSSPNIGDHIQSLAALSHVARRTGVTFSGQQDLVDAANVLGSRIPAGRRVEGPAAAVHLVETNKTASHVDALPPDTWTIAVGGFGKTPFELGQVLPLNDHLNPIFISFHVDRLDMLTDECLDYLRQHAPIGCRDWNTVHLLLSADIPAFFSGCITTTLDAAFPPVPTDPAKPIAHVDVDAPEGSETLTHVDDIVRRRTLAENLVEATTLLARYQTDFSRVVTSRLYCYLPAWAAGVDVDFRPPKRADVRFNGIVGISDKDLVAMQQRIAGVLDTALSAILSGAGRDEVYAAWAKACADDVAVAQAKHAVVAPLQSLPFAVTSAVKDVLARSTHSPATAGDRAGETVHVSIALDGNLKHQAQVVATGVADATTRPVHLYVLCRDHTDDDIAQFNAAFPDIDITWLPCDTVDYGELSGMLGHTTVATMDRLLLPYLLPDLDRVVYHDIDALTVADIGGLYDVDLGDAPLAAATAGTRHGVGGFRTMWAATSAMSPDQANDYLLRCSQVQRPDFISFNAGVMVLSLDRMRKDDFAATMLPWASMYGLNDQQVLNCYAGNSHLELDPRWNARPAQEPATDPLLIHWAGPRKPWTRHYVVAKEIWDAAEARLAARKA